MKCIDLFAGIGGIRLGFEEAFGKELSTVFVSEQDQYARKTYRTNFTDRYLMAGDITKVDEKKIPSFDICLAGFPCQAFSLAGKRQGFKDEYKSRCRGTLFLDVVRICNFHKPKVVFCENVKGLTFHDKGKTFEVIKDAFEEIGYQVFYKLLDSRGFGVPQSRERIYIVCFRNDIDASGFKFPEPTDCTKTIKDIVDWAPVPSKYYLTDTYLSQLQKHKEHHESSGNGFGFQVRTFDDYAFALMCGGMGIERNLVVDPRPHSSKPPARSTGKLNEQNIRKMTPREWARLQGFPEQYRLPLSDSHHYKQFGNTVTVSVVAAIAREIKKVLS